jgi:hypothetical protein
VTGKVCPVAASGACDRKAAELLLAPPLCPGTHGGPDRCDAGEGAPARCGAGELARRADTTAPNAGRHITALRDAALVTGQRHRNTPVRTVIQLGHALPHGRDRLIPV